MHRTATQRDVNGTALRPVARISAAALLALAVLPGPAGSGIARAQVVLPPLQEPLERPLERLDDRLPSRLERRRLEKRNELEKRAGKAASEATGTALETPEDIASGAVKTAGETADDVAKSARAVVGNTAKTAGTLGEALRPFVLAADPAGWPIEENVLVSLLDAQQVEVARQRGFEVAARRDLPALGMILVTLRKPGGDALGDRLEDLRNALPKAVVDFNHVYRFAAERGDAPDATAAAGGQSADGPPGSGALRVGMIDSAVMAEHPALRDNRVASEDFVNNEGARPLGHGTAVASLIARSAGKRAEIYAASVFFQAANYAPGATTESLIAALDWLASERVDVVNMSLAGPGNALLERTVAAMSGKKPVIVAAVGNNGPSGEPLYPSAYGGVVGVTAVDRDGRVFLYANRGPHVDYAALGVNVKVADSEGSWRVESGTSMASPHVAVVIARLLEADDMTLDAMQAAMTADAEDLGKKGFDPIFGHGLIGELPVLVSRQ